MQCSEDEQPDMSSEMIGYLHVKNISVSLVQIRASLDVNNTLNALREEALDLLAQY